MVENKAVEYKKVGISWQRIKETFPKEMYEVQYLDKIFAVIFILSLLISFLSINIGAMFSAEGNPFSIEIGFPLYFLSLNDTNPEDAFNFWYLIWDMLIFLFVSYLINVTYNIIASKIKNLDKPNPPILLKQPGLKK